MMINKVDMDKSVYYILLVILMLVALQSKQHTNAADYCWTVAMSCSWNVATSWCVWTMLLQSNWVSGVAVLYFNSCGRVLGIHRWISSCFHHVLYFVWSSVRWTRSNSRVAVTLLCTRGQIPCFHFPYSGACASWLCGRTIRGFFFVLPVRLCVRTSLVSVSVFVVPSHPCW